MLHLACFILEVFIKYRKYAEIWLWLPKRFGGKTNGKFSVSFSFPCPVVETSSATVRLFRPISESLSSHAPGPVCRRLDRILGKRTLQHRGLLGNGASHADNAEHQEYQAQNSKHLEYDEHRTLIESCDEYLWMSQWKYVVRTVDTKYKDHLLYATIIYARPDKSWFRLSWSTSQLLFLVKFV